MRQTFSSRNVVFSDRIAPATIVVEEGRISAIKGYNPGANDFGELFLLPGLVDTHVHINEPGRTEWEGFETATRAAAAGGVTTLVDMPLNCLPETTTVAALEAKRGAAFGKCRVDWRAWGGVVADNQDHILQLAKAGAPGFKAFLIFPGCDGFTMVDETQLRRALPLVARSGLPLLVHAELAGPIERATASLTGCDWRKYDTYLASRPDEAELAAIRLLIDLSREFGVHIHIVHLSTAKALPLLEAARKEGLAITVETCPHYLHFAAEEIHDGATQFKCAPPIRGLQNREMLWESLRKGIVDMIVTDHSPCPPEMKELDTGDFMKAWGGIAGLPVSLPVIWTDAKARGFTLIDIVKWMSSAPAKLAGLGNIKGEIAVGRDADFVVSDPDRYFKIEKENLHFRHPISPYVGETVRGYVHATYLRGNPVYQEGKFTGTNIGQEVHANPS